MTLELYGQVLSKFTSLATFSRLVFRWTIVLAIVGSAITLIPDLGQATGSKLLSDFLIIQRGVVTSLLFFILLLLGILLWYPIQLPRNTVVHAIVFSAYFFLKSGLIVVLQLLGVTIYRSVSAGLIALSIVCVTAWLLLLTRQGEAARVRVGLHWNRAESDRLIGQLEKANAMLAQVTRK
jgi:hypothetical protein